MKLGLNAAGEMWRIRSSQFAGEMWRIRSSQFAPAKLGRNQGQPMVNQRKPVGELQLGVIPTHLTDWPNTGVDCLKHMPSFLVCH